MSFSKSGHSEVLSKSQTLAAASLGGIEHGQPGAGEVYLEGVRQKLVELPQYSTQRSYVIARLAVKLTNTSEMVKFFTEYLEEKSAFLVVPRPHPQAVLEGQSDVLPADDRGRLTLDQTILLEDANRESLIEKLSEFMVKLHITLNQDTQTIEMSLQLGDQVVEWTRENVIIPHKHVPLQTLITIDLSECLMKMLLARNFQTSQPHDPGADVDDRVLQLCRARNFLIEHIVKQCIIFNRYYYYKIGAHDSQNFVKNILTTLKLECPPVLSSKLRDYIAELESAGGAFPLADHTELDNYVSEHSEDMGEGMMEYMALQYYEHHLNMRAEADDPGSETWKCPKDCQLKTLQLKLLK